MTTDPLKQNSGNGLWLLLVVAAFLVGFMLGAFTQAMGQTPPVSTVQALPDTTYGTLEISLVVTVESSIPWETQQVGVYWTTDGLQGWNYAGATRDTLTWSAPADNMQYHFSSTVDDDEGNSEGYELQADTGTYVCSSCFPPDNVCPPLSTIEHAQALAAAGFDLEADTPALLWYWTHPTTGNPVSEYVGDWWVDGVVMTIPGIAVGDTTFAVWQAPYTAGQTQKLRVRGIDAFDNQGEWSLWSDEWVDQGPPGSPAVPRGTLIMVD